LSSSNELKTIVEKISAADSYTTKLFFTTASKSGYTSYSPGIKPIVKDKIIDMAMEHIKSLVDFPMEEYNPVISKSDIIAYCNIKDIKRYNEVIESFDDADTVDSDIKPDELTFYAIRIEIEESETIYFYRRLNKFKRLNQSGLFGAFKGSEFVELDEKIFGIDSLVDLVIYKDEVFILNHIALERIFKMTDQYNDMAASALGKLKTKKRIKNFELFESDCMDNWAAKRTLAKMSQEENYDLVLENIEAIKATIDIFGLDISISSDKNGEYINYEGNSKQELSDILRIVRDSYYKSTIMHRLGKDESR